MVFKGIGAACLVLAVGAQSKLLAQESGEAKMDPRLQMALTTRYQREQSYAQTARMTAKNNLNRWIGVKLVEVIGQLGAPTRTVSDGGEGQIVAKLKDSLDKSLP